MNQLKKNIIIYFISISVPGQMQDQERSQVFHINRSSVDAGDRPYNNDFQQASMYFLVAIGVLLAFRRYYYLTSTFLSNITHHASSALTIVPTISPSPQQNQIVDFEKKEELQKEFFRRVQTVHAVFNPEAHLSGESSSSTSIQATHKDQQEKLLSHVSSCVAVMVTCKLYHPDIRRYVNEFNQQHNSSHTLQDIHLLLSQPMVMKRFVEDVVTVSADGGSSWSQQRTKEQPYNMEKRD